MPPDDPARFARCLRHYLKVIDPAASKEQSAEQQKAEDRRRAERLLCILSIISALLDRLDRLPPGDAQDLEADLVQLINHHLFVQV